MKTLVVRLRSFFDLLHRHFQAEPFQLANQPFTLLVNVATVEIIPPELLIRRAALQDVISDHENTVAHGDERFLLPHSFHEALILRGEIGRFLMTSCPRRLY